MRGISQGARQHIGLKNQTHKVYGHQHRYIDHILAIPQLNGEHNDAKLS